ncbi:head-tail connector protein [Caulobacter sp.]|uniref:head-tail connector protein n=1 Tax=Caulobacter sp. TaxID=78 RepID=UPI002B4599FE|nr:head-tail connector protein [Caulobacter sp.]HJV42299.1 head-tail connector protein [Caulobacter sp.]
MPQSLTLAEARAFLRVADAAEDAVLTILIDAAEARVATAAGLALTAASPAPLRLAVLTLVAHAYEHRDAQSEKGGEPSLALVEPWLTPYRKARL